MYLPRRHRQPFQPHARALLRYVCFTCVHWLVRALCNVSRFVCTVTQKCAEYECPIDKSTTLIVAGAFIFCSLLTRRRSVPVFTHIAKVAAAVCCMWLPFMEGAQLVMFGAALVAWWCQRTSSDTELVWLTVVCFPISRSSSSSSVDTPAKQSERQQTSSDPEFVLLTLVCSPSRSSVDIHPSGSVDTPPSGSVDTPAKQSGRQPDTEDRFTIFVKPASANSKPKYLDVRSSDTLESVLQRLSVRNELCLCCAAVVGVVLYSIFTFFNSFLTLILHQHLFYRPEMAHIGCSSITSWMTVTCSVHWNRCASGRWRLCGVVFDCVAAEVRVRMIRRRKQRHRLVSPRER
jgi:hypothetical protein